VYGQYSLILSSVSANVLIGQKEGVRPVHTCCNFLPTCSVLADPVKCRVIPEKKAVFSSIVLLSLGFFR